MNEYNLYFVEEIARLKREERMHEAEQYRLERIALAGQTRSAGVVERFLFQVGHRMEVWGTRLEERYRCAGEINVVAAGNCR